MTQVNPNEEVETFARRTTRNTLARVSKYVVVRLATLFITVVVGVYLTILIANMGGYVDDILRGEIRERITLQIYNNPANKSMSPDVLSVLVLEKIAQEEDRLGLNQPIMIRSIRHLSKVLVFDLGRARNMTSDSGSRLVKNIILERLPATLILFGLSNFVMFIMSVYLALMLSRHYGSFIDKVVVALSPTSAVPPWFYGIFLILIFAAILRVLPFGGMVSAPPPENTFDYALSVMRHMILPASSLILATIFISIYNWRTFFLIYSSEDYVEMAKAKGLNSRSIERRYILRPTLPPIITSFAFVLITLWNGAIITETVFGWPGLGRTIYRAVGLYDTAVIVASAIIFAYLLAITTFLLDFIYALVDPRVKIGGN